MSEQQDPNIPDLHLAPLAGEPPSQWYYVAETSRLGPVSQEELTQLIDQGAIRKYTPLWNGQGDWQLASDFEELSHLPFNSDPVPNRNPNPDETVVPFPADNLLAWFIVFLPAMDVLSNLFTKSIADWLFFASYIAACALDTRRLKKDGLLASEKLWWVWWFLPIPAYIWRRSKLLKQGPVYIAISIVVLSIAFLTEVSVRNTHHSFGKSRLSIVGGAGSEAAQSKDGRAGAP
jgi:hypothetical protein